MFVNKFLVIIFKNILLKPKRIVKAPEESVRRKNKGKYFSKEKSKANSKTNEVTDNGMNVNEHKAI